jgi:hypothetical protein
VVKDEACQVRLQMSNQTFTAPASGQVPNLSVYMAGSRRIPVFEFVASQVYRILRYGLDKIF